MALTPREETIVTLLQNKKEISISEIARLLGLNKSTVFYQLKRLENSGLIEKNSKSRKSVTYSLKEKEALNAFVRRETRELERLLVPPSSNSDHKRKLVFFGDYNFPAEYITQLSTKFEFVTYANWPRYPSPELFFLRSKEAEVVVDFFLENVPKPKEIISHCKKLRTIVVPAIRVNPLNHLEYQKSGIKLITLSPERNYKKAAEREFIIAALFALLRPFASATQNMRINEFSYRALPAEEIKGKRIGIVGAKTEGAEIIPLLHALGAQVYVTNPDNPLADNYDLGVSEFVPIKRLFDICDIVIFPEPFNKSINIDSYLTDKMKTKYLIFTYYSINYSVDKLRELIILGKLKGVFIDFFPHTVKEFENFSNSEYQKIINFPNVIITPEINFYTRESMERSYEEVFEILQNL